MCGAIVGTPTAFVTIPGEKSNTGLIPYRIPGERELSGLLVVFYL